MIIVYVNPIRSEVFRKLTIPPPTISKTIALIVTIACMCILPGVWRMLQLEFFKNS